MKERDKIYISTVKNYIYFYKTIYIKKIIIILNWINLH